MRYFIYFILLFSAKSTLSNDGAYYMSGNQLVPINETDIAVKKEILTLKKVNNQFIEVTVYYEFFNPGQEKKITVGFEALSPSGDVDGIPRNGQHPYMRDFTVELNNAILPYSIAYVSDTLYRKTKVIKSEKLEDILKRVGDADEMDFFYVYHFTANFKKGLNVIKHTYIYSVSLFVEADYYFNYILTAANRWANKQIDDFTLIVDMEEQQTFTIDKSFFANANEWLLNGIIKTENVQKEKSAFSGNDAIKFHIQRGNLIFQKKNFHPRGELLITGLKNYREISNFLYLPFSHYQDDLIPEPATEFQKKVLKNLPFARRGYVFQNPELKSFFQKMDWYIPDPGYVPDNNYLTEAEKKWVERWK